MPEKRKRRVSSEKENPQAVFIKRILWGSLFSVISFLVLTSITGLVVVKTGLSDSMQSLVMFFISLLSTFIGSFIALRKTHEKGLVSGLLVSLPVIVVMGCVLLGVVGDIGIKTALASLLMITGGALGGIAAVNK